MHQFNFNLPIKSLWQKELPWLLLIWVLIFICFFYTKSDDDLPQLQQWQHDLHQPLQWAQNTAGIDLLQNKHFIGRLASVLPKLLRIEKIMISPQTIIFSGHSSKEKYFREFWQQLQKMTFFNEIQLLHWERGMPDEYSFAIRALLK